MGITYSTLNGPESCAGEEGWYSLFAIMVSGQDHNVPSGYSVVTRHMMVGMACSLTSCAGAGLFGLGACLGSFRAKLLQWLLGHLDTHLSMLVERNVEQAIP